MKFYGDKAEAIYFDEEDNGPFPVGDCGSVQASRFVPPGPSPHWPLARVFLRTRPYGGWAMSPEGARTLAAALIEAADESDADPNYTEPK